MKAILLLLIVCALLPSLGRKIHKHTNRLKLRARNLAHAHRPGLNEPCFVRLHEGICKARTDCVLATQHRVSGQCDGQGVYCCFDVPAPARANPWCNKGGQPGECKPSADCVGEGVHWSIGACTGNVNYCCLHGEGPSGVDTTLSALSPKPDSATINRFTNAAGTQVALTQATMSFQTSILGDPGDNCRNNADCVHCGHCTAESAHLREHIGQVDLGPFSIQILRPFGDLLKTIFDEVKEARPELFWSLRTAGANCCRPPKISGVVRVGSLSNHAWGSAIDLYYGDSIDAQGDDQAQAGLFALSSYMNAKKIYWGAAFGTEDAMHFEPSRELLIDWVCEGKFPHISSVPGHPCDGRTASNEASDEDVEEAQNESESPDSGVVDDASHDSMDEYLASASNANQEYTTESGAVAY